MYLDREPQNGLHLHVRARVPASTANLGPGFDALAIALSRHTEVTVEPARSLELTTEGAGSELRIAPDRHLAVRVVERVLGHTDVSVRVRSDIPVSRGLGSSAALALAAAAAAGADDPFAIAADIEGHPENAAASFAGGFVTAAVIDGVAIIRSLPLDEGLGFVVLVPDRTLPTKDARAALPDAVPFADATFNVGRAALVIAGLADRRALVAEAFDDRLHQTQRTSLFPESAALLDGLRGAGALGVCWSGAGPTLLAVCDRDRAATIASAGEALLREHDVAGSTWQLDPDLAGLVVD